MFFRCVIAKFARNQVAQLPRWYQGNVLTGSHAVLLTLYGLLREDAIYYHKKCNALATLAGGMHDLWRPDWKNLLLLLTVRVLSEALRHPDCRRPTTGP